MFRLMGFVGFTPITLAYYDSAPAAFLLSWSAQVSPITASNAANGRVACPVDNTHPSLVQGQSQHRRIAARFCKKLPHGATWQWDNTLLHSAGR